MKKALPWLLGAALAIAAGLVSANTPSDDVYRAPFVVHGERDEPASARTLIATLNEASFADRVTVPEAVWQADGNWLVITVAASAPQSEVDAGIALATLLVDGRVFQASERPDTTLVGAPLRIGMDTAGMLVFELPPDLRSGQAELRLATSTATPRLDDVIAFPISLDALSTAHSMEIEAPSLVAP